MTYTIHQHFAGSYNQMQSLFDELRKKVEQFGSDINVYARKNWIAFAREEGYRFLIVKVYTDSLNLGICTTAPFPPDLFLNKVSDGILEAETRVRYIVKIFNRSHLNNKLFNLILSAYRQGMEMFR